jgi:hypothetical protein
LSKPLSGNGREALETFAGAVYDLILLEEEFERRE